MTAQRRRPPTPKEMQRTVDTFNANLPVGSVVEYRSDPGASPLTTVVRAEAFILSGHTPCAFVEGVAGCVALFALRAPAPQDDGSASRV
jgi:hypothetical protein